MKGHGALGSSALAFALLATSVSAQSSSIDPIIIKGNHFFYSTNHTQFYIRGVAYQEDYSTNGTNSANADYTDPLKSIQKCNRDIPYLQMLSTNVIRTYAVDPAVDHSECMNALADAGIYVISDLSAPTPSGSINRDDPQWTTEIYSRYTALIDNLSQYPNTIGFFAGNEVANSVNTTASAAFVAAAVRDSKYYISQQVTSRPLYVGYATSDDPSIRDEIAYYLNCHDDVASNVDFFGYNIYSWCGRSTYQESGYQERTQFFQNYSVPVFFAEYGCNEPEPRLFTEVDALFSEPMTSVWSGGIVYMYFQETNNYGLVTANDDGNTVKTKSPDFDNLSSQMANISPSSTAFAAISTGGTPASCPEVGPSWSATPSPLPNRPNQDLCNCIQPFLGCVVKPSTRETAYGDTFNFICDPSNGSYCDGIASNATTGDYGAYGMCAAGVQLSYVMNNYYQANKAEASASACDFSGVARTQAVQTPTGTCASLVRAAGADGTGSVPSGLSTASAIAGAGGSSDSGSSGSGSSGGSGSSSGDSSSASDSGSAASGMRSQQLDQGLFYLAVYLVGAAATGAGMLLL